MYEPFTVDYVVSRHRAIYNPELRYWGAGQTMECEYITLALVDIVFALTVKHEWLWDIASSIRSHIHIRLYPEIEFIAKTNEGTRLLDIISGVLTEYELTH